MGLGYLTSDFLLSPLLPPAPTSFPFSSSLGVPDSFLCSYSLPGVLVSFSLLSAGLPVFHPSSEGHRARGCASEEARVPRDRREVPSGEGARGWGARGTAAWPGGRLGSGARARALRAPGAPPAAGAAACSPPPPARLTYGSEALRGGDCSKMAAGCCGVKKQKLSSSPPSGSGGGGGASSSSHCSGESQCRAGELGLGGAGTRLNGLGGLAGGGSGSGCTLSPPQGCGGGGGGISLSPPPSCGVGTLLSTPAAATSSSPSLSPAASSSSPGSRKMVVSAEMCCFCFDVLYCHLYGYQQPRTPRFTNEP